MVSSDSHHFAALIRCQTNNVPQKRASVSAPAIVLALSAGHRPLESSARLQFLLTTSDLSKGSTATPLAWADWTQGFPLACLSGFWMEGCFHGPQMLPSFFPVPVPRKCPSPADSMAPFGAADVRKHPAELGVSPEFGENHPRQGRCHTYVRNKQ